MDVVLIGARIKARREELGLSLSGLAELAGLAKSYLLKLERGEVANPGVATLASIATALGLTLGQLVAPPFQAEDIRQDPSSEWESLSGSIPASLKNFLDKRERDGVSIQADLKVALAKVRYRGRRPVTEEDWSFVMSAIQKSVGTQTKPQDAGDNG